ncbi:MAG: lytic murein transglycosylase [bacterium]|nr:lytic murein transglycosylase [bacterium]
MIFKTIVLALQIGFFSTIMAKAGNPEGVFNSLISRLVADGRDSTQITRLFEDNRAKFINKIIPLNLIQREVSDAYAGFLGQNQIKDGLIFFTEQRIELQRLLNDSKIPPEIIVAMLKVESDLGRRSGNYGIFSVFATLAVSDNPTFWRQIADTSAQNDSTALDRRAKKRARWAYRELNQFLDLCSQKGWDPLNVMGSWAGAFGWAQFLPSSYLRCARDGDDDGVVNLHSMPDAVASMVYYLEEAGWAENRKSQYRALLNYNPSNAYADCILEYAKRLKTLSNPDTLSQ